MKTGITIAFVAGYIAAMSSACLADGRMWFAVSGYVIALTGGLLGFAYVAHPRGAP